MGRIEKAHATRTALLEAAVRVIGKKGYSGATVDEIVKEAGVSKGIAYYHFKGKGEIASLVLKEGIDTLIEQFEQAVEHATSGPDALTLMIESFSSAIFERREFGRFFVSELWREGRIWSEDMRGKEKILLDLIKSGIERSKKEGLARQEIDVDFEAAALVGMVLTTALYYIDEPVDSSYEKFIANVSDFVHHANRIVSVQ